MTKFLPAVVAAQLCLAAIAIGGGQKPKPAAPPPAPEVKKLHFFVGLTTTQGVMTVGTTQVPFTATGRAKWMPGGRFVEHQSEYSSASGKGTLMEVMGWDDKKKVYTHNSYSGGVHVVSTGTLEGDTWTWTSVDGRSRHTITMTSPTTSAFKAAITEDGKTWVTLSEGTRTTRPSP